MARCEWLPAPAVLLCYLFACQLVIKGLNVIWFLGKILGKDRGYHYGDEYGHPNISW